MAETKSSSEKQTKKIEKIVAQFDEALAKTNKEHPSPADIKTLSSLLNANPNLDLWRNVASAGYMAELSVLESAHLVAGLRECWKHRLQVLKNDLGIKEAPMLEQLLIQQAALCWLKLNLVELG